MELTLEVITNLLALSDTETTQGKRDYLILSMLCHGIQKSQIARLRAFDFSVEGDRLVFGGKKGKIPLSPKARAIWDAYVRALIAEVGVEFVKSKPVFFSFSTNKLKTREQAFGITPEAIQQIAEKYFRKLGICKQHHANIFKQDAPSKQKTTSEIKSQKGFLQKRGVASPRPCLNRRGNKRYRNRNRYAHYKHRLLERKFCLDANYLTSKGFFKGGLGGKGWAYSCSNKKDGPLGEARLELWVVNPRGELGIRVEPASSLLANPSTVRVAEAGCRLGGQRWWFYCHRCGRKVFTLYYHYIKDCWVQMVLACRRCQGLVYLSQARGINRIGFEAFKKSKEEYKVIKSLVCKNVS